MKTTTFQSVLNAACRRAMRTPDQLPAVEQLMLQDYLALDFRELFNAQCWPELIPNLVNVAPVNQAFSRNEGTAQELGDILAVLTANPHASEFYRAVGYSVGDNTVWLDEPCGSVWVEYLLPYPSVAFPDLRPEAMTLAVFLAASVPLRWESILSHKAAAHLLTADGNAAMAGMQFGLADKALAYEIQRLDPVPPWRGLKASPAGHRRLGTPHHWP